MLKATDRAKGGNPELTTPAKKEGVESHTTTLAELGINYKTSSLAQKLSALPEAEVSAAWAEIQAWTAPAQCQ